MRELLKWLFCCMGIWTFEMLAVYLSLGPVEITDTCVVVGLLGAVVGTYKLLEGEAHMNGCGNAWWVSCDTEGCVCQIGGKLQHTELQAAKAWNKRAKE